MDYLFSPWRYRYLTEARARQDETGGACVLCAELRSGDDRRALVVQRGRRAAVMLNRYPYTVGHMMVLPLAHCATLSACGAAVRGEMMELAAMAEAALEAEYRPEGLNVGVNLGAAGGAGIAGHLHLHVVPRWMGDANFISVVGETRVLPEMLGDTYDRLRRAFAALSPPTP
jgi:ATP adenylyltransferase